MRKGKFIPPAIQAVGFDFDWDNQKLWTIDLPVEVMPISDLIWHFDLPFWRDGETWFVIKPADVLAAPDRYPEHRDRINQCDLHFPAYIMWHKGRWVFLDGMHRLAKAVQLGETTLPVKKFPAHRIPEIQV